jgi:hypothetical protein
LSPLVLHVSLESWLIERRRKPLNPKKSLSVVILALFMLPGNGAFADKDKHDRDRDRGHWRERDNHEDRDDDDDRRGYGFAKHDRDELRLWYGEHRKQLPPGLSRRDVLRPEQERELVVRTKFPQDLDNFVVAVPVDLERRLAPPPPDCERVAVAGHIVIRNRKTKIILDIFHFE